jgi:pilus assembly protein Flp/PilA
MMNHWKCGRGRLVREEAGVTSIEYALIASLIAVACIAATISLGSGIGALFAKVCHQVGTVSGAPIC